MRKLSVGDLDSTLGNWALLCAMTFGPTSKSAEFFKKKILESPLGGDEEVVADESQLLMLVLNMERGESDG